ncbi:NUDIX hydrolase [Phytohalomonas tamaricis]|uniref:NUDIX hydrolase n=1 Tax=Phytohalomonas tamaricis TaxID=2081032 RepID=UPI000D0AD7BE|nr:NUDIX domain-containing protein [Phytohalomonas tamaricis]
MADILHVVAGCLLNAQQQLLVVRKRNTPCFMLPGGKHEHGETPVETLAREWHEELGCELKKNDLVLLGRFRAPAANEPDTEVDADVFVVTMDMPTLPQPGGEIEEVRWLSLPFKKDVQVAPLLEKDVLPALQRWI